MAMTDHRYMDEIVVNGRRAVFLWFWPRRFYARVRYEDGTYGHAAVMDIKPLAQACVEEVRDAFNNLEAAE